MKPIKSSLKRWMQENKNFQENYTRIKKEVLNHPEIKEFLSNHQELTEKDIEKNLIKLYEYISQSKRCNQCQSFAECKNILQGYTPVLQVENKEIHLFYEKCPNRLMYEKETSKQKLIQSLYVPKEILQASFAKLENDPKRSTALKELFDFLEEAKRKLPEKGIYFSGPFGVGKTYFLGVLANELKKLHISSMLVYMPEFVREIRSSLKDNTLNEKIDYFKNTEVLMFDDIGAEMHSAWFRDEILGSILQYRMMEKLPVFFTSNYNLEQLQNELASTRDGVEEVKAGRIIERIKQVSKAVPVQGENRRN
ncbi:MAG TPA: primosomal protein DnaI [Candidatus Avamphibacillus sp.]|nr:primosomal protein DnaI [Candidatus Avamphibacillus sp.]